MQPLTRAGGPDSYVAVSFDSHSVAVACPQHKIVTKRRNSNVTTAAGPAVFQPDVNLAIGRLKTGNEISGATVDMKHIAWSGGSNTNTAVIQNGHATSAVRYKRQIVTMHTNPTVVPVAR